MRKAKVLFDKGMQLFTEGDWPRASEALREALDQLEEKANSVEEKALVSLILRRKAHADSRLSELELALNELEQALEISTDIKDNKGMADAHRGIGYVHIIQAEPAKAMESYTKALKVAEGTDDMDLIGRIRLEIGNVHMYWYDFEKAKAEYGRALSILKAVGNNAELARVYNNLGEAHKETGDLEESIEYHRRCMDLAKKIGNITLTGFSALNAAECFIRMRELKFAREYLGVATRHMKKSNDRIGQASVWRIYGQMYLAEGNFNAAEKAFQKSLDIARSMELPNIEAEAMLRLAEVHIAKKGKPAAKELLKKVIIIFKGTKRTKELIEAQRLLDELEH